MLRCVGSTAMQVLLVPGVTSVGGDYRPARIAAHLPRLVSCPDVNHTTLPLIFSFVATISSGRHLLFDLFFLVARYYH